MQVDNVDWLPLIGFCVTTLLVNSYTSPHQLMPTVN